MAIRDAFGGARMPTKPHQLASGGIDGPYVVKHFLGRSVGDVEDNFLPSLHMEDFTYMTEQAVRYYLPAPLRLMLETPYDDELWLFLRGFLKEEPRELTAAQRRAIADWAQFLYDAFTEAQPFLIDASEALALAIAYKEDSDRSQP